MISVEDFFLESINDLKNRIAQDTEYSLLRAVGLIRQLLADTGTPLLCLIGNHYRIKLKFDVAPYPENFDPKSQGIWKPSLQPESNKFNLVDFPLPDTLDLERFLKRIAMVYHGFSFSVLDFVKLATNIRGGVHVGFKLDDRETQLFEAAFALSVTPKDKLPYDIGLSIIHEIGSIVLNTAEPIVEKLNHMEGFFAVYSLDQILQREFFSSFNEAKQFLLNLNIKAGYQALAIFDLQGGLYSMKVISGITQEQRDRFAVIHSTAMGCKFKEAKGYLDF